MRDTTSLQIAYDSLKQYEIITSKIHTDNQLLTKKIDSLIAINKDLSLSQNYFSDIINSQMAWFGILFGITFGVLGLIYWLGIIRYFNNKFKLIEVKINDIQTIEDVNNKRLDDKIDNNNNRLQVSEKSLDDKIKKEVKFLEQRLENVNQRIDESIEKNSLELREIIEDQKTVFEKNKLSLLNQIKTINFDVHRSMFFTNYHDKDYFSALTWVIGILKTLSTDKKAKETKISDWIVNTNLCVTNLSYSTDLKESIDSFNKDLDFIKDNFKAEEFKNKIELIKVKINKLYYSNVDLEKGDDA